MRRLYRSFCHLSSALLCLGLIACGENVPESGRLELSIPAASGAPQTPPGFADRLVMSRIGTVPADTAFAALTVQDAATLRLSNPSDEPLSIVEVDLNTEDFTLSSVPPAELAPGASFDLVVNFVASEGRKGLREGTLEIRSSGGNAAAALAGLFMEKPEGISEVNLQTIVDAFGYTADIGLQGGRLSEAPSSAPAGDEVRAARWSRADASRPVYIRQLAAYHTCCSEENFLELVSSEGDALGRVTHAASYSQSVLPLSSEGGPAELTVEPSGAFEIVVGSAEETYSTDTVGNLAVRLWPVGVGGQTVSGAYIVAQEAVRDGCSSGEADCDYQDNVFLVTNIQPAP